jgi:hypothetical protein
MYNVKKKKNKKANNDPQNTTQVLRKGEHFLLHPYIKGFAMLLSI